MFVVKGGASYELVSRNQIGEVLMATPAIAGKLIIIRGQNHRFGIGEPSK